MSVIKPLPCLRKLSVPQDMRPTLLVVVDTEEEFDWGAAFDPNAVGVRNIAEQPRAQDIFDRFGIRPTYVIDHPVAATPDSADLLAGFAAQGRCDIGAHLHPWVNPPLQGEVSARTSYPGNLPPGLEHAKLDHLTRTIAQNLGIQPVIYKAGRYGVGAATPGILAALGYRIDCSLVPWTDFSGDGGPDFSAMPDEPFEIAENLVELPLSVGFVGRLAGMGPALFPRLHSPAARRLKLPGIAARTGLLERLRLSPEGHSLDDMVRQTDAGLARGKRLFMMTYHSSALLPGATPYVRSAAERDDFLHQIAQYCAYFVDHCGGAAGSLTEIAVNLLRSDAVGESACR